MAEKEQLLAEIPYSSLEKVIKHIVQQTFDYHDEEEASIITQVLLYAQIRGNSQGAIKLLTDGIPKAQGGPIITERETKLSARLNGQGISGFLVMDKAVNLAITKAKDHGMSIVATNHTSSGTGAIGYYGRKIALQGLVGIVLSQSPEFVAPFGSYEAIYGTNPFSFGIPLKDPENPLVLDMATSAIAWYKVKEAKYAGQTIPGDVAYDAKGRETTNPAAALAGAIRVFDRSYKGSHIALMVEILADMMIYRPDRPIYGHIHTYTTGALAGGEVEKKHEQGNWGNLVIAIDPELLGPAEEFREKVQALLDRVKGAKRLPDHTNIPLPGERSEEEAAQVRASGIVKLERNLYEGLMAQYRSTGGSELA